MWDLRLRFSWPTRRALSYGYKKKFRKNRNCRSWSQVPKSDFESVTLFCGFYIGKNYKNITILNYHFSFRLQHVAFSSYKESVLFLIQIVNLKLIEKISFLPRHQKESSSENFVKRWPTPLGIFFSRVTLNWVLVESLCVGGNPIEKMLLSDWSAHLKNTFAQTSVYRRFHATAIFTVFSYFLKKIKREKKNKIFRVSKWTINPWLPRCSAKPKISNMKPSTSVSHVT